MSTSNPVEVTEKDLPVHCPVQEGDLWNSHPRVFIPVSDTGEAACPYCGTVFRLVDQSGNGENAA